MRMLNVLSDDSYNLSQKDIIRLAEKASSRTIDSLVQNTNYESVALSPAEKDNLSESITTHAEQAIRSVNYNGNDQTFDDRIEISTSEAIYPLINRVKLNIRYNYLYDLLIFTSLGILSLVFAFLLKAEDRKKGYGLEKPNIVK